MDIEKIQKEINFCALMYSRYKNDPDNRGLAANHKSMLLNFYMHPDSEYRKYLIKKSACDLTGSKISESVAGSDMIITDVIMKAIKEYDHRKNDNFTAYFFQNYNFRLGDFRKLNVSITKHRENGAEYYDKKTGETREGNDEKIGSIPVDDENDILIRTEYAEIVIKILSMFSRFSEHYHGKAANERKLYYYSLFITDRSVSLIKEFPEISADVNQNEFFNSVNTKFLDYFMKEKCLDIPDILKSRLKTYGQITDNCSSEDENREAEQPLRPAVYIKYIFNDKGEKISDSAFSQQKKQFDEKLKQLLND